MNKISVIIGGVALLIVVGVVGWQFLGKSSSQESQSTTSITTKSDQVSNNTYQFQNPKKSAHFESNTPAHGAILAAPPVNIVIDFNFDLAKPSSISITKDGKEYGVSETIIDINKLTLRKNFDYLAPDGIYTVNYKACWPDGSCHDGSFQFAIVRSEADNFMDMRNQDTVTINLANITFNPRNVRISKGAQVVWTNSDDTVHYINTDSHPAHTYYKEQNSQALNKGDTYSLVFDAIGAYPYHCSAHAVNMTGMIIVE